MWAYEYEAGKFIAGEILGDTLYMYAPTGRGEKWVMNSEGIVLEYSSEPFHKSDEIIAGINAHYGTSFYQEDDIDKDFTIGETMPNWNAYEKIELPEEPQYFRIYLQDYAGNMVGWLLGNIITLCMLENTMNIVIAAGGKMTNSMEGNDAWFNFVKNSVSNYYGISKDDLQIVNSEDNYSVGDEIPYYSQCVKI